MFATHKRNSPDTLELYSMVFSQVLTSLTAFAFIQLLSLAHLRSLSCEFAASWLEAIMQAPVAVWGAEEIQEPAEFSHLEKP